MIFDKLARRFDTCQYGVVTDFCCPPVTGAVLDEGQAEELATLLKALADPVRIRLVSLVAAARSGEVCACDLPAQLDRSQPTVSHHLTQLVRAGVLHREQRGRWAWFRLRPERLEAVCIALGGADGVCGPVERLR